jgi:hypothetical protein
MAIEDRSVFSSVTFDFKAGVVHHTCFDCQAADVVKLDQS